MRAGILFLESLFFLSAFRISLQEGVQKQESNGMLSDKERMGQQLKRCGKQPPGVLSITEDDGTSEIAGSLAAAPPALLTGLSWPLEATSFCLTWITK